MLAAVVYYGLGYNPNQKKSPIPKEISDAVTTLLGENLDIDTSRKWLKEVTNRYPKLTLTKTE